jgi:hypothetical protein
MAHEEGPLFDLARRNPKPFAENVKLEHFFLKTEVYELVAYARWRVTYLAYLKTQHLVHKHSKLPFEMFFDDASMNDLNLCVFFYDEALTQIVYTGQSQPHLRLDPRTRAFQHPKAGNGNIAYSDFLENGMMQTPDPWPEVRSIRFIKKGF